AARRRCRVRPAFRPATFPCSTTRPSPAPRGEGALAGRCVLHPSPPCGRESTTYIDIRRGTPPARPKEEIVHLKTPVPVPPSPRPPGLRCKTALRAGLTDCPPFMCGSNHNQTLARPPAPRNPGGGTHEDQDPRDSRPEDRRHSARLRRAQKTRVRAGW